MLRRGRHRLKKDLVGARSPKVLCQWATASAIQLSSDAEVLFAEPEVASSHYGHTDSDILDFWISGGSSGVREPGISPLGPRASPQR